MLKIIPFFFIFLVSFSSVFAQEQRKKIGLALSGGGAKGAAHIGVLKVLEEAGIPIDYIAGTSMGAIIGGLYSIGYRADQLDSLVRNQDWNFLLSDNVYRENRPQFEKTDLDAYLFSLPYERKGRVKLPPGFVSGQNIYSLFLNLTIGYHTEKDFAQLPIPFRCVAADVRTGSEYDFQYGLLPMAMRASMAIPGFFAPVELDSMLLIDGGIVNNYPVDLVKKMGADIVIGIRFPPDEKEMEEQQGSVLEITGYLNNFLGKELLQKNIRETDLLIEPNLSPFNMASFQNTALDTIVARGEKAARNKWNDILALKNSLLIPEEERSKSAIINPFIEKESLYIQSVKIEGLAESDEKLVRKQIQLEGDILRSDLQKTVSKLYGTNLFSKVYYQLEGDSTFDLKFNIHKKNINFLNIGVRFDTEDVAAILANTTIRLQTSMNSMFDVTARLSKNPYLNIDYSLNKSLFFKSGFSYRISRNNINIYSGGKLSHSFVTTRNMFNLNFSEFYIKNIRVYAGVNLDYSYYFSYLKKNSDLPNLDLKRKPYVNYFIEGYFDNLNRNNFPTSGQYLLFRYTVLTDDFYRMKRNVPTNIALLNYLQPIKISPWLYLTPEVESRVILNENVPTIYKNYVGGNFSGHYLPQQISLEGSNGMEILKNAVVVTKTNLRYEINDNHFFYTNLNFTLHNNDLFTILKGESYIGGNIGYSYNTFVGPLTLELGYSSLSRTVYPFLGFGYYF
ncbi:MAG: patatin-like phospholipase family protein [Dysgonamonadaceae bacterium]|nr:patatin-like phospholipase family protein [Dysgonamonadaceae bacterium]